MRIDLPFCTLKTCRHYSDSNCSDKTKYDCCEFIEQQHKIDALIAGQETLMKYIEKLSKGSVNT